jgi:peptidoglycan/LPS O-acetylase OafA/YrhL
MPALDGLRALAVLVVVLYHGEVSALPGGFLGVEVFFVISGYLITALLVAERTGTGGTAYLRFWARRARRLLPALFALAAVVGTWWLVFHHDEVATIRGDIAGALTYVTNWYQIVVQQSYFEAMGRPSPLRHLWSLAVEEQFYLIWPVALAGIWRLTGGRRSRMAWITLGLAAASAVLAMSLYHPGADPSRVYYGTDTRAAGVLLGALLAIVVPPWRMRAAIPRGGTRALDVIGLVGIGGILVMVLRVSELEPFVYQGGFIVLDVLTVAAILALVHPCTTVWARIFSWEPLLWIGRRSYGIYLWHWPVFVLTRPGVDIGLTGFPLLVLRLALTFGIAELSYRYVEMPVRNGALGRWWARRNEPTGRLTPSTRRAIGVGALAVVSVLALLLVTAPRVDKLEGVDLAGVSTDELGNLLDETTTPPSTEPATTTTTIDPTATTVPLVTTTTAPPLPQPGTSTIAIGDSVLLGARSAVRAALPGITVNAEVGRQFNVLPWLIPQLSQAGALRPNVVLHLGTNGPPTNADLAKVLDELAGVNRVVLVNTSVERSWQDETNSRINAAAAGRPNVVVADWYAASAGHPEYFVSDGVHLTKEGGAAYAAMIAAALG